MLGFLLLYAVGGRKIAVPYGIALTNNPWLVILFTAIADFFQIPFFYFIYSTGKKIVFLDKVRIDATAEKAKIKRYAIWNSVKKLGNTGIFVLSMLPSFGGGIWSSVLLAFLLKTNKNLAYLLIVIGSLIGIIFLAFFSQGVIQGILSLLS